MKQIHVIDSHTGGEPTRLVMRASALHGAAWPNSVTNCARHDQWRKACLLEPRGNDVLVGALYCPPVSPTPPAG
jgi:4-hydroxyproline epimerase